MDETEKTVPEMPEKAEPEAKPDPEKPAEAKPETNPESKPEPQTPSESVPQPLEATATNEVAALRADLARAQTERTAVLEAARMGIDAKHIDYVLKLADLPADGKPEDIQKALQKVLDDVPAFRVTAPDNRHALRIGAKDPKETNAEDALAKAFGNTARN